MKQLAQEQQAQYQPPVQTLAAIGRGIGPFLGTLIISQGDKIELGLGPSLMLLFSFTTIALSILVPSAFGARFYEPPQTQTPMW